MITLMSKVLIIDNSGGLVGRCIKVYNKKKTAKIGDCIMVSVIKIAPESKIKKGEKFKAIIVRSAIPDKYNVSWDDNAVVLVSKNIKTNEFSPIGSRIKGPIAASIPHNKILALAKKENS